MDVFFLVKRVEKQNITFYITRLHLSQMKSQNKSEKTKKMIFL